MINCHWRQHKGFTCSHIVRAEAKSSVSTVGSEHKREWIGPECPHNGSQGSFHKACRLYSLSLNSRSYTYTKWNQHMWGHTCAREHAKHDITYNALSKPLSLPDVPLPCGRTDMKRSVSLVARLGKKYRFRLLWVPLKENMAYFHWFSHKHMVFIFRLARNVFSSS